MGVMVAGTVGAQPTRLPLASTDRLVPHNTTVEAVRFGGRNAVRVAVAPEVTARPEVRAGMIEPETYVRIADLAFANGVIEVEVASAPAKDAPAGARGFAGLAFRLAHDRESTTAPRYDAFYLRPTNGRSDDQERRNHAAQYISHPDWTWSRLRRETPSRYEAYVDLVPDRWTRLRIDVRGAKARLFVNGAEEPTLIVNDLKTGPGAAGGVALWIGPGTVAYFRKLVVTPM
ncbi:MAG: DUF1080 domain-containing protein [Gemmatimonadaceae bacterium]|jgi:hypothetical protein|nr:DUF1080 domain-containing protein [Gemmatimonadaceae bacterium]